MWEWSLARLEKSSDPFWFFRHRVSCSNLLHCFKSAPNWPHRGSIWYTVVVAVQEMFVYTFGETDQSTHYATQKKGSIRQHSTILQSELSILSTITLSTIFPSSQLLPSVDGFHRLSLSIPRSLNLNHFSQWLILMDRSWNQVWP